MKTGSTAPVIVIEDTSFSFKQEHLTYLNQLLQSKILSDTEVSYIADGITLTDSISIESDELLDALELLIIDTLR